MTSKPAWYQWLKTHLCHVKGFKENFRLQFLWRVRNNRLSKIKKQISLAFMSISVLSVFSMLILTNFNPSPQTSNPAGVDIGMRHVSATLNEEMWFVDAIVLGNVLDVGEPKSRHFSTIIPVTIQVDEVLYGDVSTSTITLLQHGNAGEQPPYLVMVGEQLILLLSATTTHEYWPYDHNNGIWTITEGRVYAHDPIAPLDQLNGTDLRAFKELISKAALKSKKPEGID